MRHEGQFFLFKSEKKTDEGQLKQMREAPENLFFFFFLALFIYFLPFFNFFEKLLLSNVKSLFYF